MQSQAESMDATTVCSGSRDGLGAGDHDAPYHFGRTPRLAATYPFNTRQYARLLVFRGRVRDGLVGVDDVRLAAPSDRPQRG